MVIMIREDEARKRVGLESSGWCCTCVAGAVRNFRGSGASEEVLVSI